MDDRFRRVIEELEPKRAELLACAPVIAGSFTESPARQGVYLFSEGPAYLYVGRSNTIRRRYGQHCNPGSQHNQAVFAFKLARQSTGNTEASYSVGAKSRRGLLSNPSFAQAFLDAKSRIRAMEFRWVEEADQTKQALLELYCAISLNTEYNDFDTH